MLFRSWGVRLSAASVALLLVYLVIVPLVLLGISSLRPTGFPLEPGLTLGNFGKVFLAGDFGSLVGTTVVFALGSTALAMVIGTLRTHGGELRERDDESVGHAGGLSGCRSDLQLRGVDGAAEIGRLPA